MAQHFPMLEPHYARLPAGDLPRHPLHVVCDNIRSAYNVGSIFRTADACGAAHVHLCGMSAHPPHHKLEKTALGAQAYVPWTYYERTTACVEALQMQGVHVAAVEVTADAQPFTQVDWPQPSAVVFGNEVNGITMRVLGRVDRVVCIPMHGHKNSINVATAAGIVLYGVLAKWGVA